MQHDLALVNGNVVTLDGGSRIVDSVAVRHGRIVAVDERAEIEAGCGPQTRVVDVGGRTVIPGLYDAHPHMDREGLKLRGGIRIRGQSTIAEITESVRNAAAATPPGEWIVLMPMELAPENRKDRFVADAADLDDGRYPTREDLDEAAPDHPVIIRSVWGWWSKPPFPCVLNSRALALAGITRDTEAPYNTEIVKDARGEPIGVLLETNRAPILEYTLLDCVPRFAYEDRVFAAEWGAKLYNQVGTTAAYEGHGLTPALIHAYQDTHQAGRLSIRLQAPLSVPSAAMDDRRIGDLLHQWANRLAGEGAGDEVLRTEGICLDLGDPEIARIIARGYPYEQWAGHFYQSVPWDRLTELGLIAARLGIRLNCLACYDLDAVLAAFEAIDKQVRIRDRRWVLIHLIEASDEQLRRIKELGVVVTVTPNLLYEAVSRFEMHKLGDRAMPLRRLIDAEIPVALSSDNVPISMLWAMWSALSRWDSETQSKIGQSYITREEALRLVCQTGHLLNWRETQRGAIEIGKDADLAVLETDPLSCDEDDLKEIDVVRTFLAGREVYTAE